MSSTTDKIKGYANETIGKIKQSIGRLGGSDKTRIKGKLQEQKGEAQKDVGKLKEKFEETKQDAADELHAARRSAGDVKRKVGR